MLIVGAVVSSLSALLVLWAGERWTDLDTGAISADSDKYLMSHPDIGFGALAAFFLVSYALGGLLGGVRFFGKERRIQTNTNGWHRAFYEDRPNKSDWAFVTLDLEDGSRVAGNAWRWTAEFDANRELLLRAPLAVQRPEEKPRALQQDFVLVREEQIRVIQGHYVQAADTPKLQQKWWHRCDK